MADAEKKSGLHRPTLEALIEIIDGTPAVTWTGPGGVKDRIRSLIAVLPDDPSYERKVPVVSPHYAYGLHPNRKPDEGYEEITISPFWIWDMFEQISDRSSDTEPVAVELSELGLKPYAPSIFEVPLEALESALAWLSADLRFVEVELLPSTAKEGL